MFVPLYYTIKDTKIEFLYQHSTSVWSIAKCRNESGMIDWLMASTGIFVDSSKMLYNLKLEYNYQDYKLPVFPCKMVRHTISRQTTRLVENKYEYYKALEDGFLSEQELEESV